MNEAGALVYVIRNYIPREQASILLDQLRHNIPWQRREVFVHSQYRQEPRLTFPFGQRGLVHYYSGSQRPLLDWNLPTSAGGCGDLPGVSTVRELASSLHAIGGTPYNSILLNWYPDHNSHISAHSDKETSKQYSSVATVSLGQSREFILWSKLLRPNIPTIVRHGDVLFMEGNTQKNWKHQVPPLDEKGMRKWERERTLGIHNEPLDRISITLRHIGN